MINSLKIKHAEQFNKEAEAIYFSPGRVNLIGEHTDYSGGHVLPLALELGTYGVYSQRDDDKVHVYSELFESKGIIVIDPNKLNYDKNKGYINYIEGMLKQFSNQNLALTKGFNLYLSTTLPTSAGLSSSASLEVLIAIIIDDIYSQGLPKMELVKMAQAVENDYLGLSSGVMDQFAVTFGRKHHAMFLNTKTLDVKYAPLNLTSHTLVMMNTNKKRDLVDSDYNERFNSVKVAQDETCARYQCVSLCEAPLEALKTLKPTLDATIYRRMHHVLTENNRTIEAYNALVKHDYNALGHLMDASHQSLKEDFEVSCDELDYLVDANHQHGAIGARMTGAGFGGTMVALYDHPIELVTFDGLKERYQNTFNKPLDIYIAKASSGALKVWSV